MYRVHAVRPTARRDIKKDERVHNCSPISVFEASAKLLPLRADWMRRHVALKAGSNIYTRFIQSATRGRFIEKLQRPKATGRASVGCSPWTPSKKTRSTLSNIHSQTWHATCYTSSPRPLTHGHNAQRCTMRVTVELSGPQRYIRCLPRLHVSFRTVTTGRRPFPLYSVTCDWSWRRWAAQPQKVESDRACCRQ